MPGSRAPSLRSGCNPPAGNFSAPLPVLFTEAHGSPQLPFVGSRVYGDKEDAMEGKYNNLLDHIGFRLALNVVVFCLWLGLAVALVAAA